MHRKSFLSFLVVSSSTSLRSFACRFFDFGPKFIALNLPLYPHSLNKSVSMAARISRLPTSTLLPGMTANDYQYWYGGSMAQHSWTGSSTFGLRIWTGFCLLGAYSGYVWFRFAGFGFRISDDQTPMSNTYLVLSFLELPFFPLVSWFLFVILCV
ncbi:hypothetical protein V8F20_001048 [Naviculisporaceae sp. PSN 640]